VVADSTNKRYVFASTTEPNIVWVDLNKLDFGEGTPQLKLDLISELSLTGGLAGDVTDRFEEKGPLTFLSLQREKQMAAAAAQIAATGHAPAP